MSGDTSGPTRIYGVPQSAYTDYARTDKKLEETRKMAGQQGPEAARLAAQRMDTIAKPDELAKLFGTAQRSQPVVVGVPPGFDDQLAPLNVNAELVFGSQAHLDVLGDRLKNVAGDPREQAAVTAFVQAAADDMRAKNSVLNRRASLQQA